MERVKGIEPSSFGWEPKALPLSYTRNDATGKRAARGRQVVRAVPAALDCGDARAETAPSNLKTRAREWGAYPGFRNRKRWIFPVWVLGKLSQKTTRRGYL